MKRRNLLNVAIALSVTGCSGGPSSSSHVAASSAAVTAAASSVPPSPSSGAPDWPVLFRFSGTEPYDHAPVELTTKTALLAWSCDPAKTQQFKASLEGDDLYYPIAIDVTEDGYKGWKLFRPDSAGSYDLTTEVLALASCDGLIEQEP